MEEESNVACTLGISLAMGNGGKLTILCCYQCLSFDYQSTKYCVRFTYKGLCCFDVCKQSMMSMLSLSQVLLTASSNIAGSDV